MKRYLVTGGAGFIGSQLVRALLNTECTVRVLDNLSSGDQNRLEGLKLDFQKGDIRTPVSAAKACQNIDTLFHLAAIASVARGHEAPLESYETNVGGTMVLLEAARRAGVKRVVFASSCAVYGHNHPPLCETMPPEPLSLYAASKLAGETLLQIAARNYGLITHSLRIFNVYGPGQNAQNSYAAVIPQFLKILASQNLDPNETPTIFGDGKQSRDFVSIEDVVQAFLKASELEKASLTPINIGSGKATSILELFEIMKKLLGSKLQATHAPARQGDVYHSFANVERAKKLLNWSAQKDLEYGLKNMLQT